jgi:hypothetical protein
MGEIKTYYENGEWREYESVWDGRELLPPYESRSITAATIEQMRMQKRERRAPKEGYRIAGRLRRKQKDAE